MVQNSTRKSGAKPNARKRTRDGCLGCRLRKKSCTGRSPGGDGSCTQCVALNMQCLGFPENRSRPRWMREDRARLQRLKDRIKAWTSKRSNRDHSIPPLDLSEFIDDGIPDTQSQASDSGAGAPIISAPSSTHSNLSPGQPSQTSERAASHSAAVVGTDHTPPPGALIPAGAAFRFNSGGLSPTAATATFSGHYRSISQPSLPSYGYEGRDSSASLHRATSSLHIYPSSADTAPTIGSSHVPLAGDMRQTVPSLYVSPADVSPSNHHWPPASFGSSEWRYGATEALSPLASSSALSTPSTFSELELSPSSPYHPSGRWVFGDLNAAPYDPQPPSTPTSVQPSMGYPGDQTFQGELALNIPHNHGASGPNENTDLQALSYSAPNDFILFEGS